MRRARVALLLSVLFLGLVGLVFWERGELPSALSARIYPLRYEAEIGEVAARHGVDPYLVAAVVKTESGFDADAVSSAGATGLMQLMPETAEWIVRQDDWRGDLTPDLRDPADNLDLGTYYLAYLIGRFGDRQTALAAYNAGLGVVERWLREAESAVGDKAGRLEVGFSETREFVERVERYHKLYQRAHPLAFRSAPQAVRPMEPSGTEHLV